MSSTPDRVPDAPDLGLVPTSELLDELRRRHTAALIVLYEGEVAGQERTHISYKGRIAAMGLAHVALRRLEEQGST